MPCYRRSVSCESYLACLFHVYKKAIIGKYVETDRSCRGVGVGRRGLMGTRFRGEGCRCSVNALKC